RSRRDRLPYRGTPRENRRRSGRSASSSCCRRARSPAAPRAIVSCVGEAPLVAVLHIDRAIGRLRAELRHAEFGGDGAGGLIDVIDAGNDTLESGRVECPVEYQLTGLFRDAPGLRL